MSLNSNSNVPESGVLESVVVTKPDEKISLSSDSNITVCCKIIFWTFLCGLGTAVILAVPICEIIIYSLHENKCKSNDVVSLSTYLIVSGVVDITSVVLWFLFIFFELEIIIVAIHRLFSTVWIILGFISLIAYNWTDDCKSTHTFKMSMASLIIHLLFICVNPKRNSE